MILRTFRRDDGFVLVTAILVMAICLMVGVAALALVDGQQNSSRQERTTESTFSYAEGVLNTQIFLLSDRWPALAEWAYDPAGCNQATTGKPSCPSSATLAKNLKGVDYAAGVQWATEIHDNLTGNQGQFYDDALVRQQPGWDSNGDGLMWVRASALVRGRRRTLIALVKAEKLDTLFPRNAIVANTLTVAPNGNQTYVDTTGSYVTLHCSNGSGGQLTTAQCQQWNRSVQVGPNAVVNVDPNARPALSPETLDRMRDYANASGTYFANCPANLTGAVVFIETATTNCDYKSNAEWNTQANPGVLIIGSGHISFDGTTTYHGVLYHANGSDGRNPAYNDNVVTVQGNACIDGAVVIDGGGGLKVGASNGSNKCNGNIQFEANASNNLHAYGTAGIVQNSFREIVAKN